MRSALLSVAFLAGSVFAAPQAKGYGYKEEKSTSTTCTEEQSKPTVSPYQSESTSSLSGPGRYTHTFSGNSSSYSAYKTGSSPSHSKASWYPETTTTEITTVYTTVCPVTTTGVQGGQTIARTYETTSTITSVLTSTITVKPSASAHSYAPSGSKSEEDCYAPYTSVTEITSFYATPCPATSTDSEGKTHEYQTTSTVTEVKTLTVLVSPPTGSAGGYGSGNGGSSNGASSSQNGGSSKGSSGSQHGGSSNGGSNNGAPGYGGSQNGGSGNKGSNNGASGYGGSKNGGSGGLPVYTTVPWGTTILTYKLPTVAPTPSNSYSHGAGASPTQSWGAGNNTSGGAQPTGSGASSGFPHPTGTGASSGFPRPSGTAPHSSSSSTSTCSKPTPTSWFDNKYEHCVPCEGQPGNDPDNFCGYTINDNWYEVMPKTCGVKEYFFEMTNTTVAPDGIPRMGLVINGQMPGPKIEANWGDTIIVHVKNSMQDNGTSLHFHGMRQLGTNEMDGVASITQCAMAPGDTMTYTFKATNYGTSWYHSHFALQTYEGIFGPMVIHGPAAEEYDFEETIVVQDWSHATADMMYEAAQTVGIGPPGADPNHGPRTLDTGLINGMNTWGGPGYGNSTLSTLPSGKRFQMNVIHGKTYRLRLVNTAIQSTFKFHIDGHTFKVIANDYVPIHPYETDIVNINIGQRYDLIFKADQPIGNYWMRADNQQPCAQIHHWDDIKGIVSYVGATPLPPTSTSKNYTAECVDEPYASLVPIVPLNAGPAADETIEKTVVVGANGGTPNLYKWTLSGTTFQSQWGDATLSSIVKNGSVPDYSGNLAIEVPNLKEWVYVIIDSPIPLPHPIHLHGHDFLILAQGEGMYDSSSVTLNTINPPRRDVALMPWDPVGGTGGHLVLAFESDNPGVWLMHCHIGWHTSMGFALQIIENLEGIKKTVEDSCQVEDVCKNWNTWTHAHDFDIESTDSGI